jgi:hypothetical protein
MDTSPLHQIALAPATDPDPRIAATYLAIGLLLAVIGTARLTRRDLQTV